MGFFSELKSDLSQAVNTLMPEDKPDAEALDNETKEEVTSQEVPTDLSSMLERLDDISPEEEKQETAKELEAISEEEPIEESKEEPEISEPEFPEEDPVSDLKDPEPFVDTTSLEQKIEEETQAEIHMEEPKTAIEAISNGNVDKYVESVNTEPTAITNNGGFKTMDFEQQTPTDEVATITEGMLVKGDLATTGSLDLIGKVTGNIKCLGKLTVTGEIAGDSDAAEVYAESARITGEVKSKGSVKIGQSTVIVGNIFGTSAVIAGAVKGDIDVHGPVVLDTTAIVMGNIKSQSVQINNGAVIEGMCSQSYADVNPSEFFEGLKNK